MDFFKEMQLHTYSGLKNVSTPCWDLTLGGPSKKGFHIIFSQFSADITMTVSPLFNCQNFWLLEFWCAVYQHLKSIWWLRTQLVGEISEKKKDHRYLAHTSVVIWAFDEKNHERNNDVRTHFGIWIRYLKCVCVFRPVLFR